MASVIRRLAVNFWTDRSKHMICDSSYGASAILNFQDNRGCKRSTRKPTWFVRKKNMLPFYARKEITPENKEFLNHIVEERYVGNNSNTNITPLKDGPWKRPEWQQRTTRTGLLAIKIGVIPQYNKKGRMFHVTLLQVIDNHVIRYTPPEKFKASQGYKKKWAEGWGSVVVGAFSTDPMKFSKSYNNLFTEAGVPPKNFLTRFLVSPDAAIQPGTPLYATHFRVGDYVDVQAKTIGHGFQGVIKRWGMKGGPKSHGSTKFQRRPGSISAGREKSGVWKGKKMPGHMGMSWRTMKGLKIWRINTKYNVLYVTGPSLPGPTHCQTRVYDSRLRHHRVARLRNPPHNPTSFAEDLPDPLPEEMFDKELHQFGEPTLTFDQVKKSNA